MNGFYQEEIERVMKLPDSEENDQIPHELWGILYSLGRDAENEEEEAYAFQRLLQLSDRKNASVRAQALLGMALLAQASGRLDRTVVEPILRREWRTNFSANRHVIADALDDLNFFLGWNMEL